MKSIEQCLDDAFSVRVEPSEQRAYWMCPLCNMAEYDGHEQNCPVRILAEEAAMRAPSPAQPMQPVLAWLVLRCDGSHELVMTLTDDVYMDDGDEAWPLRSPEAQKAWDGWHKELREALIRDAIPRPEEPCDLCHGTGQVYAGNSGSESDGNAPEFERCQECGHDDAPRAEEEAAPSGEELRQYLPDPAGR